MLPAKIYTIILAANGTSSQLVSGRFFKILTCTGSLNVTSDFGRLEGIGTGQGVEKTPFNYLTLTDVSGATNTVKIVVADENFIDTNAAVSISGLANVSVTNTPNVSVTNTPNVAVTTNKLAQSGSFANTQKTVTNASTQLVAANAARQYLLVQNKDATGNIYLNFGAGAATTLNGILISAGGSYELDNIQSTQAIQAIGSLATQSNVVVVEG